MKLETSNLAHRWTAVSNNEKNAKLGQKGSCGVLWPPFGILGPFSISVTTAARNFKCDTDMNLRKNGKLGQNGSREGHGTHFWNFTTPNIWGRLKLETNLAQKWRSVSCYEKK